MIVKIISILGMIASIITASLVIREEVVGGELNVWLLVFSLLMFGFMVVALAVVEYFKDNMRIFDSFNDDLNVDSFRSRFEKEQEAFLEQFKKAKHSGKVVEHVGEAIDGEIVERDPFKGDPVYDNLGNIFNFAKEAVKAQQRDYVDAEFTPVDSKPTKRSKQSVVNENDLESYTVAELKDMCKDNGLTGYSAMRKAELIEVLAEYNRAQK